MKKIGTLIAVAMMSWIMVGCSSDQPTTPNLVTEDVLEGDGQVAAQCETNANCLEHGAKFCIGGQCYGQADPDAIYRTSDEASEDATEKGEVNVQVDSEEPECAENTDCPYGEDCVDGECFPAALPECLKNEDCDSAVVCECKQSDWQMCTTHVCENNACVETIVAEPCEFGCEVGQCLPPMCESDSDCAYMNGVECDEAWQLTITGGCFAGYCVSDVSAFACEFGCADGVCLPDPELIQCESDVDCIAADWLVCFDDVTMSEHQLTGKCVAGACEEAIYFFNCDLPCVDGCYECWSNDECGDKDKCTADWCVEHKCVHENMCAECQSDADCGAGGGVGCLSEFVMVSTTNYPQCVNGQCLKTEETIQCKIPCEQGCFECWENSGFDYCDDKNPCTEDACQGGECVHKQINNCVKCTEAGECGGAALGCWGNTFVTLNNLCDTLGYCTASSTECEFGCDSNLGCKAQCESVGDCADMDDCTTDSCVGGKCQHENKCVAFGEYGDMKQCDSNADCAGTDFGDYCVEDTESGKKWCQYCCNSLKGDADIKCPDGEKCVWGFVGDDELWASVYSCVECVVSKDCDDGNPCTEDTCGDGKCEHDPIKGCFACDENADCGFLQVCYEYEGADTEWTWTGNCSAEGKCEISEKKCLTACDGDSCEKLECESDADCGFGQYCSDNFLCGWTGDLQCKFICPEGNKKYAVIWWGAGKEDKVACNTEVWTFPQPAFCSWGACHPAFKFNLWDGDVIWGEGNLAELQCNAGPDELLLTPAGQGVMLVYIKTVYCGFGNCPK